MVKRYPVRGMVVLNSGQTRGTLTRVSAAPASGDINYNQNGKCAIQTDTRVNGSCLFTIIGETVLVRQRDSLRVSIDSD